MSGTSEGMKHKLRFCDQAFLACLIALAVGAISLYILFLSDYKGIDFKNILSPTRNWLAGKDIYAPFKQNLDPSAVPYPFTAYLAAVPFTLMPDWVASAVFIGLCSGLLAWQILRNNKKWYLLMFLSWPFAYNLYLTQFAPLAVSLFFSASFLPVLLFKPQLAIPFALTQRPNRVGLILTGLLFLVSIMVYPAWPVDWLTSIHTQNYIGFPPLFMLPFGPLILLSLLRYRKKQAWLLVLLALMPQRMVYDQLGVMLVAENRNQIIFLVLCSWISFPALFFYHGWANLPYGWQQWVMVESYIPALLVILWPVIKDRISKICLTLAISK